MCWWQWTTKAGKMPKYQIQKVWYSNWTEPNNTKLLWIQLVMKIKVCPYFKLLFNFTTFLWDNFLKIWNIWLHFFLAEFQFFISEYVWTEVSVIGKIQVGSVVHQNLVVLYLCLIGYWCKNFGTHSII